MRLILACTALILVAAVSTAAAGATKRKPCVVPRVYALSIEVARTLIVGSGCRLGTISFEKPRARVVRVTDQVPPPGAILSPSARVSLIVS